MREPRAPLFSRQWIGVTLLASAAVGLAAWTIATGWSKVTRPARCPSGFVAGTTRCCPQGQKEQSGRCVGRALVCPERFEELEGQCVVRPKRIYLEPGQLVVGPGDWEAQGVVRAETITIDHGFWLDSHEVTMARWLECASGGMCPLLAWNAEPGQPATHMSYSEAQQFCSFAGGRLPTDDEWVYAASGPGARRYPWGDTGAVCRRASWGLLDGPCATGASAPELAGLHEDDSTPEGIFDLAANVSEWVEGGAVRGGSFGTRLATELRTWHRELYPGGARAAHVGFRCRYPGPNEG